MARASRLALVALLATLASCLNGANSVNLYGGVRNLEDGSYDDADEPIYYALDGVFAFDDEGLVSLAAEVGVGRSDDDEDAEVEIDEIYGGLRLIFPAVPLVKPYVSVGLSQVDAEFQDSMGTNFDDDGLVPYLRGGVAGQLGFFRLGADLRYLTDSDLSLGPVDSVEGLIGSLFVGIAF